eukprot:jgi/Chlat1/5512/Chrsp360S05330
MASSACAMLPAAVANNRPGPLLGSARFSLQACGGVREHRACCVLGSMTSSAPASSHLQHQRRQSELKHLRHAIVPSAATPRWTTVVSATAAPAGNSGSAKTFAVDKLAVSFAVQWTVEELYTCPAGGSGQGGLFGREYELEQLEKLCSGCPKGITVIHGPRNCGKTKILEAFVQRSGPEGTRSYIDCRMTAMRTHGYMADALIQVALPAIASLLPQKATAAWATQFPRVLRKMPDGALITSGLGVLSLIMDALVDRFLGKPSVPTSLQSVLQAYNALLDAWEAARKAGTLTATGIPVLVIDYANVIMDWSKEYPDDLKDCWMEQNVGAEFYQTYAIGEFTESEARGFTSGQLQSLGTTAPGDAEWRIIYNACGGNAGVLRNAAVSYVLFGSWQKAVRSVLRDIRSRVQRGYTPLGSAGYERKHLETAVTAILNSPYKAVNAEQLQRVIPPEAFDALIAANLLGIRCSSDWARDIDELAFGPDNGEAMVVTALTSAHLAVWRERASRVSSTDNASTQVA